jgi:glycosyltransferase involved in cell wall biosynthesis
MTIEVVPFLIDKIETGGAEKVILRIASYFTPEINAHIFTSVQSEGLANYDLAGLHVHNSKVKMSDNYASKIFSIIYQIFTLVKFIRYNRCKKVVSFLDRSNFICVVAAKLTGVRSVVSVRNNIEYQYSSNSKLKCLLAKFILRIIYSNADTIIALSKGVEQQLLTNYGLNKCKVRVIYNPYPINYMYQKGQEEIVNNFELQSIIENGYFISVGRLSLQKDHEVLLVCFSKYIRNGGVNSLIILGDGELKESLVCLVSKLDLHDKVFFLGYRADALSLIAKADAFLFSSKWEGFGNACLEAMAVGTYIISSDCDFGPKEILDVVGSRSYPVQTLYGTLTSKLDNRDEESIAQFVSALLDSGIRESHNPHDSLTRALEFDQSKIFYKWAEVIMDEPTELVKNFGKKNEHY